MDLSGSLKSQSFKTTGKSVTPANLDLSPIEQKKQKNKRIGQ